MANAAILFLLRSTNVLFAFAVVALLFLGAEDMLNYVKNLEFTGTVGVAAVAITVFLVVTGFTINETRI